MYRLVTVCANGDFIVLPHWETRSPVPSPDIPLSHITLTQNLGLIVDTVVYGKRVWSSVRAYAEGRKTCVVVHPCLA